MHASPRVLSSLLAGLLLLPAPPASAENGDDWDVWTQPDGPRRLDISLSTGVLFSSDWSDLVLIGSLAPFSGALQQVLVRDLAVTPGPVFAAAVTYWEGRLGVRVHGAFSNSCLAVGTTCPDLPLSSPAPDGEPLPLGSVDVRTWLVDMAGLIGFTEHRRGQWVRPYGFIGVGAVVYHPDQPILPPLTFIERPGVPPAVPDPIVIIREDTRNFLLALEEVGLESSLSFNFGIGTDLRIPIGPGGVGLRLEVSDHITRSPLKVRLVQLDDLSEVHLQFGPVHNLRFVAGMVFEFGLPDW